MYVYMYVCICMWVGGWGGGFGVVLDQLLAVIREGDLWNKYARPPWGIYMI